MLLNKTMLHAKLPRIMKFQMTDCIPHFGHLIRVQSVLVVSDTLPRNSCYDPKGHVTLEQ